MFLGSRTYQSLRGVSLLLALFTASLTCMNSAFAGPNAFVRGDANADGIYDLSDPVFSLFYSFLGGEEPPCQNAADYNADGLVADFTDAIESLRHQFLGGTPPALPFPACGLDPIGEFVSCESYPPCREVDICVTDLNYTELGEEDPALFFDLPESVVTVGDELQADVRDFGAEGHSWIDWGDGLSTIVDKDGPYYHSYATEGEYVVELFDGFGEVVGEETVVAIPRVRVEEAFIRTRVTGFGAKAKRSKNVADIVGVDGRRPGVIDQPSGVAGCFVQLFFDIHEIASIPGGEWIPFADPVVFEQWSQGLRQCNVIVQGQNTNGLDVTIVTKGNGEIEVTVVVEDERGQQFISQEMTVRRNAGDPPMNVHVPSLPGEIPGTFNTRVIVESVQGQRLGAVSHVTHVFAPPANCCNPCDWIIALHGILSALKDMKKAECDDIAAQLAQARADLKGVLIDLALVDSEKADLDAELADLLQQKKNMKILLQAALGDHGTLIDGGGVPADSNFVGSYGVGVAFTDAPGLLAHSDANGNLLGQVGDLGNLTNKINKLRGKRANAQAREDGLQAQKTGLENKITDLEAQLAACKAECKDMEGDIETLEMEQVECLLTLARLRASREAVQDAAKKAGTAGDASSEADDAIREAEDAVDGSAGSPEEKNEDEETIDQSREKSAAAKAKVAEAEQKLRDANNAVASGDHDRAVELADQAEELAAEAEECLREAINLARSVTASAGKRPVDPDCVGVENGTEWKTRSCYKEYIFVSLRMVPATGQDPDGWDEYIQKHQSRLDDVKEFMKWANRITSLGRNGPKVVGRALGVGPLRGPRLKGMSVGRVAEDAIQAIFDAYARLISVSVGVNMWIVVRADEVEETLFWRCVHGRKVLVKAEYEVTEGDKHYEMVNKGKGPYPAPKNGGVGGRKAMSRDLEAAFIRLGQRRDSIKCD